MRSNVRGILYVLVAGSCWGIIGLFTRYLAGCGFSPMQMAFFRSAVAGTVLWVYILCFRRCLARIEIRDIWVFIGTGVASLAFFNVLYFSAQQVVSLSVAAMLLYTAPFFVMLMSVVFFREQMFRNKVVSLALAASGCVCVTGITGNIGDIVLSGILMGLGSGFCYALYSVFGSVALKKYEPITVTAYTFLFAVIALAPLCDLPAVITEVHFDFSVIITILLLGTVSTLIPYMFYTRGLELVEPTRASIAAFIEPVVATAVGVLCFDEILTAVGIAGIILIFIAIIILMKRRRV